MTTAIAGITAISGGLGTQAVSASVAAQLLAPSIDDVTQFRDLVSSVRVHPVLPFLDPQRASQILSQTLRDSRTLVAARTSPRWIAKQAGTDGPIYDQHTWDVPEFAKLGLVGDSTLVRATDPKDTVFFPEEIVFRQYTTMAGLVAILASQTLRPGPLSFSYNGGGHYLKLVGAFLTFPQFSAQEVGVPTTHFYVDLQLMFGTGMLVLNDSPKDFGRYLMIPGTPKQRDWISEAYEQWVARESPSLEECHQFSHEAFERSRPFWFQTDHPEYKQHWAEYSAWVAIISSYEVLVRLARKETPTPSQIPIRVVGIGGV